MKLCISDLVAGIARELGDREAIVTPAVRRSWAEFDARVTGFARGLVAADLGYDEPTDVAIDAPLAERVSSRQPHVGILSGNCPEYIEAMTGAFRARCVPVNMNYRYTPEELAYVVRDASLAAVVYQRRYGPTLGEALGSVTAPQGIATSRDDSSETTGPRPLVDIDDGSGVAPLPGSVPFEDFAATKEPEDLPECQGDDRYVLYTGGTTGFPKGVLWRQEDWFLAALGGQQRGVATAADVVEHTCRARRLVGLPASPMMHGAGHWSSFSILLQGGTVVLPPEPDHLDAAGIWQTVEAEGVVFMQVVGDAFLRPLLDELDHGDHDVSCLRFLLTSGAIASPARKATLLERIPRLRIIDTMGASESGATAESRSTAETGLEGGRTRSPRFHLNPSARVVRDGDYAESDVGEEGLLAQTGAVPLGYLGDETKTAATFPVIRGRRYSVPGDHAVRVEGGDILLLGRGSQCINTGGEKVYPEEVEQVLKAHDAVADALVAGVEDPKWGQAVGAVVELRPGRDADAADLDTHLREHLAGYKIPKRWAVSHERVSRNQVGKPDYAWARAVLSEP